MNSDRPYVLTTLHSLCRVCAGRPLQLRALDGRVVDLPQCPHCGPRYGIPYLICPPYQDRKSDG